jgi:hypothetical protein
MNETEQPQVEPDEPAPGVEGEPGKSDDAPGHDPNGPGRSEDAPGHDKAEPKGGDDDGTDDDDEGDTAGE